jgi:hypothetical protein
MGRDGAGFSRHFEGKGLLDELLALAGSPLQTEQVLERFQRATAQGEQTGTVIPELFPDEPRFPDPSLAQRLFQNLLGLWDLAEAGGEVSLETPERRPRGPKVKPVRAPEPYGQGEPDAAFVDAAWQYLQDLDAKGMAKLQHGFENRQDALLGYLDEADLSESGYATARYLVFELCTMLELGSGRPLGPVGQAELKGGGTAPSALEAYVDEALTEAEQDEQEPIPADEAPRVREHVRTALGALWRAAKALEKQ